MAPPGGPPQPKFADDGFIPMPRYFLHIRDGDELIPDEEGTELPDLDAAKAEAIAGARDILAEKLRSGERLDGEVIEIADEAGNRIDQDKQGRHGGGGSGPSPTAE